MKKAFTLIELLAVIIILAVVALIATPIVLDVVKDTKESAAKSQAYMILDGAKLYYTESMFDNSKKAKITGVANIYDEISMNGKKPENGKLYINKTGLVAMAVLINNKCYKKEFAGELQITEDQECDAGIANDSVIPTISLELNSNQGTVFNENGWANKDIWVDFNVTDNESGAYSYTWCTDNKECEPTNEPTEKVSGSFQVMYESETSYACAYGYDLAGNKSEKVCVGPYKIDKKAPTLAAVNEEVSINQGDDNLVSSYFTVNYSISGGTLSCNPINTSTLEPGTQTVTCTAIGNNGLQTISTKNIIVKPKTIVTYGGSEMEDSYSIIQTSDGGSILTGITKSTNGDINVESKGGSDLLVIKLDSNGNKTWVKTYGGSSNDAGLSIIHTTDGGYIITGQTESNDGDITTGNKGLQDILVIKLDANGNKEWLKTYGGSKGEKPNSIIQTSDGYYMITGYTDSNDGDVTANKGNRDIFILKLNNGGNKVWLKTYGGSSTEDANSIIETTDGSFTITGNTYSVNGDMPTVNKGNNDVLIMKLDSNGNKLWAKTYGGSTGDIAQKVIQTSDGGYILAGYTSSTDGDMPTVNKGNNDVLIMKLDSNGNKEWIKTYGGSGNDRAFGMVQDSTGQIILAGDTTSIDGDILENKGATDVLLIKLDSNGNKIWVKTYGGSGSDVARNLALMDLNTYILTGYSGSSDGDISINKGNNDILIIKVNN